MKQSDPIELVEAGSLKRPGPIGRSVRLAMGMVCSYAVFQLIAYRAMVIATPVSTLPNLTILVLAALLIINYVVNIGFGRSFRRWPSYLSLIAAAALAGVGWILFGTPDHPTLGLPLWLWLLYFYVHLGICFILAAIFATPGCEMRSIPELLGRIRGRAAREHHCPAAFITKIDQWEKRTKPG